MYPVVLLFPSLIAVAEQDLVFGCVSDLSFYTMYANAYPFSEVDR